MIETLRHAFSISSASFMVCLLLWCTRNVKDRAQVDNVGLHLQILWLFVHQYLNSTFTFPGSPIIGMLDVPDTNFMISSIDTSSVVATQ